MTLADYPWTIWLDSPGSSGRYLVTVEFDRCVTVAIAEYHIKMSGGYWEAPGTVLAWGELPGAFMDVGGDK